jgi:hypothetical protein
VPRELGNHCCGGGSRRIHVKVRKAYAIEDSAFRPTYSID